MGSQIDPRTRNLRVLSATALKSVVEQVTKDERAEAWQNLLRQYKDTGATNAIVQLPDGTKIATVTVNMPQPTVQTSDEDAYIKWVEVNYPTEVEYVPRVRPAFTEALVGRVVAADDGALFDPDRDGLQVDGLKLTSPAEPTSFSVHWTNKRENLPRLLATLGRDEIAALLADTPLALGAAADPQAETT